jgi:Zn-dependent protease with chaperone function
VLLLFLFLAAALSRAGDAQKPVTFHLPPGKYEKAIEFHRRVNIAHFAGVAWDCVALALMIRLGFAPHVRDWVAQRWKSGFVRGLAVIMAVFGVLWLWSLPLSIYRHALGLEYGLSIHPWAPWLLDWIKAGLITGIPAALVVLAFYAIARRTRAWWLYGWALGIVVMIAGTYLVPVVFDPLFFHFTPLMKTQPDLVPKIEAVAARGGFQVASERIFEMDASRKTPAVNAYMTGFGSTKRIVIWDTTIHALTPPQIQTVFAHELGHYALHHIPISIALSAAVLLIGFWLLDRILRMLSGRFGSRWGISSLEDYGALPLALLLALGGSFLSEPLANSYSRWQEHQADIYELEAMHSLVPAAGRNSAEADQVMANIDLDDPSPNPFIRFWLFDHPPTAERMAFAQEYDPWSKGQPPKYVR